MLKRFAEGQALDPKESTASCVPRLSPVEANAIQNVQDQVNLMQIENENQEGDDLESSAPSQMSVDDVNEELMLVDQRGSDSDTSIESGSE